MKPEECPVLRRASDLSLEIKRSLRRLEKTLEMCRPCLRRDECDATDLVREAVVNAAREILEEMGG